MRIYKKIYILRKSWCLVLSANASKSQNLIIVELKPIRLKFVSKFTSRWRCFLILKLYTMDSPDLSWISCPLFNEVGIVVKKMSKVKSDINFEGSANSIALEFWILILEFYYMSLCERPRCNVYFLHHFRITLRWRQGSNTSKVWVAKN